MIRLIKFGIIRTFIIWKNLQINAFCLFSLHIEDDLDKGSWLLNSTNGEEKRDFLLETRDGSDFLFA